MYNYKDKAVHVRDLSRERFADTDREILRAVSPNHPESLCVRPASQRHEIVLHALLDIITREEVEKRREAILNPAPVDGDGDSESVEDPTPAPTHVDGEDNAEDVDNPAPAEDNSLLSEVADQANQLEGRVDELEGQISDLSDELNAKKKSEPKPQKNKRKKSTH